MNWMNYFLIIKFPGHSCLIYHFSVVRYGTGVMEVVVACRILVSTDLIVGGFTCALVHTLFVMSS